MITVRPDDGESLSKLLADLEDFSAARESCFLCGTRLTSDSLTREHVVPLWVQKRYDLLDASIVLLNSTCISYRSLTVPCCRECNNCRLGPLEVRMSKAVENGKQEVDLLGRHQVYLWLSKIQFGIVYKELSMLADRRNEAGGMIIDAGTIKKFRDLRFFMQQLRGILETGENCPGSIRVLSVQQLPEPYMRWDYCDNTDTHFVGCRVGRVALFGCLNDGGAEQSMDEQFLDLRDIQLHPI